MDKCAGVRVERGRIVTATDEGYTVASYDRDGIVSPPIPSVFEAGYAEGTLVYFVLFADGTGKIIGAAEGTDSPLPELKPATQTRDGLMSATDKTKLDHLTTVPLASGINLTEEDTGLVITYVP